MPNYYVVGSMNNWTESSSYLMVQDSQDTNKFNLARVSLQADDKLKVKSSDNDWYSNASTWTDCGFYLDGDGNVCIITAGDYDISFYLSAGNNNHITVGLHTYTKLNTPEVTLTNNVISWSAISHATGYKVYINSEAAVEVSTASYTITKTEPGTYSIRVSAISTDPDYLESDKSTAVVYTIEGPVTDISYGSFNNIQITDNSDSYTFAIGGMEFTVDKGTSTSGTGSTHSGG